MTHDLIPVSVARDGFTPAQAEELLSWYTPEEGLHGGDVSLFYYLHINHLWPTATVSRQGNVVALEEAPDGQIGRTRVAGPLGELSLDEYLAHPGSRAQGMVVVHRGRKAFEAYPGMRDFDNKMWASNAKTTVSLVMALLVTEGKVDPERPVEAYLPGLAGTDWAGTRVLDVLDMASGLDVVETPESRDDPRSAIARLFRAGAGRPDAGGRVERQWDVIRSARRIRPAGQAFEYSSMNTLVLVLLAEAVENRRWHEIFRDRVWSRMTVEGDLQVAVNPQGTPQAHGIVAARLRDMARYGMLYTPSWPRAAREKIVPDAYVRRIQTGGRREIYLKGELGNRLTSIYFTASPPLTSHWQWDGVFADGDIFKAGVSGQGLYVSPGRDLVVVWHSTIPTSDLTHYARRIAETVS